jgi:hypothetical protein
MQYRGGGEEAMCGGCRLQRAAVFKPWDRTLLLWRGRNQRRALREWALFCEASDPALVGGVGRAGSARAIDDCSR